MSARISVAQCHRNQGMAAEAASLILSDEESIWTISEILTNRMLICPRCPRCSTVSEREAQKAFRKSVDVLSEKIDRFREHGPDPELQALGKKRSQRKYREAHRGQIRSRAEDRRIEDRIAKLKGAKPRGGTNETN